MRIKADWNCYLQKIRSREFATVFANCPKKAFGKALELGAGDGFASTLLAGYAGSLVSTDLDRERLQRQDYANVIYRTCDAEHVGETFDKKEFDLVFSSNLLEHLPDCPKALRGVHKVLKDEGITIHYLPNRYWKLTTTLLYIPNKTAKFIDRILSGRLFKRSKGRKRQRRGYSRNNPKTHRRRQFFLAKFFLPKIHGVSSNTISEFIAFGKNRWIRRFEQAGFEVLCIRKVGFNSGYGFGCDRVRRMIEKMGVHTCYAYIAIKAGCQSTYRKHFLV